MDFRILGPLEVLEEGRAVRLGGSKQRALLALFLLHRGETLGADRLIDELWAERPPATAAKTMQVYVSRLRKTLGGGEGSNADCVVATRGHGYELMLDPERLDAHRFERLVAEGRAELAAGHPQGAAAALERALSLWRGPPLADLAYEPFAQHEIARLDDLRVAALEALIDAKLALGAHAEVVAQLEKLIAEHPYRERLRAQLMLAHYRADRQADALQAYQNARRTLVEELGIEPGERLRRLERAILAQDPKLQLAAAKEPPAAAPETPRSALPGRHRDASALVGRGHELARIHGFLERAASGPAALVLEGEPGIGKTTLLREAVATASDAGANVLLARPAAAESALAFAGLRDLLGDALDELVSELPPPQANALEVALLLREAGGQPVNPHAVSAGVLSALGALARQSSVVVAVDDIQWLDKETSSALAFALRRLSGERVGLVASLRLQHRMVPPELVESLPPERVIRLPIGSLSVDALHRVIRLHAGRTLPRPTLEHTHEVTGGNPFYALQLVRSLPANEPRATLEVPPSIATLTHQRLDRLPRAVRHLLEPAALLRDPTVRMLEALSAEPGRVGERLDQAVAAGVVELSSDGIRFAHPLLAEGMATMIGPGRRRQLHAELASLVDDPEQRARHLALAASGPSPEIADQVETGARAALARGASATAAELLETAAALTPRDQKTDRQRRTIEAARTCKAAGLPALGRKLLQSALDELPVGLQRADALVALAELSNDDFEAADSALAQALDNARGDDERLSVIHRERAYGYSSHVGYDTAVRHARFSVAAAERAGEPRVLIPALTYLAALETWHGRIESDSLDRALELQRRERLPLGYTYSPNLVLGLRQMAVDRLDEARGLFEAEAVDAERRGDDYAYSSLLAYLVELECRAANFGTAAAHASECALRSEQRGEQYQAGAALWTKALVDAHLGRVEEARAVAERGTALSTEIGEEVYVILNQFALGFAELSLGDPVRADAILRPLPPRLVELGWDEPSLFPVWPNAIEALVAVDERDVASNYLRLFEERAISCDCPWALATAARCRGLLLVAAGDADRALTAYEQALKEHQRTPGAFERCRTLLALGSAQRRARQGTDARETLQAALTGFDELGATLWAAKTRAELR
jgi:DNA-binding SARP family transcriptional activator